MLVVAAVAAVVAVVAVVVAAAAVVVAVDGRMGRRRLSRSFRKGHLKLL